MRQARGLAFGAGERAVCAGLAAFFGDEDPRVVLGIGDDAAILRTGPRTVVTHDPVVEGVHFDSDTPLHLVGQKAIRRSLSDLAAMGACARHVLIGVLLPRRIDAKRARALFSGLRKAARQATVSVVGGDVARTTGPLVVNVTAIGEAPRRPLRRDTLRPGMTLHCTGALGGSILGRHLRFRPRLAEGAWLAAQPGVAGGMDISDGLVLDLQTMLDASGGRGAVLDVARIPIHADARRLAAGSGRTALGHALSDGEDHELLFAVRKGAALPDGGPLLRRARRPIGTVTARPGIWVLINGSERPVASLLAKGGFEHDL